MKKLLFIAAVLFATNLQAQKNIERYYQASYFGMDSIGSLRYGNYFFSISNNKFPTIELTKAIVIIGHKLKFTPLDDKLIIWLTEFKTKKDYLKWDH